VWSADKQEGAAFSRALAEGDTLVGAARCYDPRPMSELIFKIVAASEWRAAEEAGRFTGSAVDLRDGYIHFSTRAQAPETARRHFAGQADLLLVAVSADALGAALRWEPSRNDELFPHLYAELPITAARWVKPLPLDDSGAHVFPQEG
jgi:uncharacterized protein (DUF952 family)